MDSHDTEIIILEEITDGMRGDTTNCSGALKTNGDRVSKEDHASYNGDDEIPDFDDEDLEVLDCWEDPEDCNEESEPSTVVQGKSNESRTTSQETLVKHSDKQRSSQPGSVKRKDRTSSCDSGETIILEDLTRSGNSKKANTEDILQKKGSKDVPVLRNCEEISKKKASLKDNTSFGSASSKKTLPTASWSSSDVNKLNVSNSSGSNKPSQKPHDRVLPSVKNHYTERSSREADAAETKVENFLKEIALQHPKIIGLQNSVQDEKSLESISSESSENSSPVTMSSSNLDTTDLPPALDLKQVSNDGSTSRFPTISSKASSSSCTEQSRQDSSQKPGRKQVSDVSNLSRSSITHPSGRVRSEIVKEKEEGLRRSRSPKHSSKSNHANQPSNSGSPSYRGRKTSPARSFTLSPTPSPQGHRSPLPSTFPSLIPSLMEYNHALPGVVPHNFVDRTLYQTPPERTRYHRSPAREPTNLRALSRSLSRERVRHRSRSRSRGRTYGRHRSRSRPRYPSIEERHRRYRRSSSRSRSPARRPRSRSPSWSSHPYVRKRSPLRDDSRAKRPRMSRSRSRSPWKQNVGMAANEWHGKYPDMSRTPVVDEDIQLEQDMARFVRTNLAATGLIPPVNNSRGWYEPEAKSQDVMPSLPVIPEPPVDIIDREMPLPPPPPDISELMAAEEVKSAIDLQQMTSKVSLSSLLESAVADCPAKIIMERCQDAIAKLHDGSIKPGRFAVIPSIKAPYVEFSSSFQPWQSVLNRSLANKVQFSFCIPSEQPVFWESPKPKPVQSKDISALLPSLPIIIPSVPSTTADLDRAALLDKIFFLTRDLQEVRQLLDRRVPKKHVAVQTSPVKICENCRCDRDLSAPPDQFFGRSVSNTSISEMQQHAQLFACVSTAGCVSQTVSTPMSLPGLSGSGPVPAPSRGPVPKPVPTPTQVAQPARKLTPILKVASTPKSVAVPVGVAAPLPVPSPLPLPGPVPAPLQAPAPRPVPAPRARPVPAPQPVPAPKPKSLLGPEASKTASFPSSSDNLRITSAQTGQSQTSAILQKQATQINDQQSKASSSKPVSLPTPSVMPNTSASSASNSTGYCISNYVMIGDEYMCDLVVYLRSVGVNVNAPPELCAIGMTLDSLQRSVGRTKVHSHIALMLSLFNQSYGMKVLNKYKQLIGFLRKRCVHLILIEPPPIPKWGSIQSAWKSFSDMQTTFFDKTPNVTPMFCHQLLLSKAGVPNMALYANAVRLGDKGVKLLAEELQRVIENKRILMLP